jgi:tRNA(fMet)-specific endonuclease VapC
VTDARFLLDSNICIYVLRDSGSVAAKQLGECRPGTVVTSAIAFAEVIRGLPGTPDALEKAERFFDLVPPLSFDAEAARAYAEIPFKRAAFDRLIAAHALSAGLTLVTNNERDFGKVRGLKIENWTKAWTR